MSPRYPEPTPRAYRLPRLRAGDIQTCRHCGEQLIGILIRRKNGQIGHVMPCHYEHQNGDGQATLVLEDDHGYGHVIVCAPEHVRGREVHWGRCPNPHSPFHRTTTRPSDEETDAVDRDR